MSNHRISDALVAGTLELKECTHILFKYLLVVLVVNLGKNRAGNDAKVTRHTLRYIRHLNARQRAVVVGIKVNYNRVFTRNDIILTHHTFGIPNDIFTLSAFFQFCRFLFVVGGSYGICQKKQPDTVNFLCTVYEIGNLIQFAFGVMNFAKYLAVL